MFRTRLVSLFGAVGLLAGSLMASCVEDATGDLYTRADGADVDGSDKATPATGDYWANGYCGDYSKGVPASNDCKTISSVGTVGCCDAKGRSLWCENGKLWCVDCGALSPNCGWVTSKKWYDCGVSTKNTGDPSGQYPYACQVPTTSAGTLLGSAKLTYFWVISQSSYTGANDTELRTCDNKLIAKVPSAFAKALRIDRVGKLTGLLSDGTSANNTILGVGCACGTGYSCFVKYNVAAYPNGAGNKGTPLEPYTSVAVDNTVIPAGTKLYSPDLDGVALPGGGTHDGCVRADDTGDLIKGLHLDWFVVSKASYQTLSAKVPANVRVYKDASKCTGSTTGTDADADADTDADTDTDSDTDSDTDTDTDSDTDVGGDVAVTGLDISSVALYQAVKIPLMNNFAEVTTRNAPVVQGRKALLRVFVTRQSGFVSRNVTMKATFTGASGELAPITKTQLVSANSTDATVGSTFNIEIPATYMTGALKYAVSLTEADGVAHSNGTSTKSRWPATGTASVGAATSGGPVKLVLVPIKYTGGGSNLLPDTSTAQIAKYKAGFQALYPTADVTVEVTPALTFSGVISPNGNGWSELLNSVTSYRASSGGAANEYYYGLVNPNASFNTYCASGCVTGLSWVATSATYHSSQTGTGVGFTGDSAVETALHEVGHAFGRGHTPCGDVSGVDTAFPYSGGAVGVWGLDQRTNTLIASTTADFMSYCDPTWTSDYTYKALFSRLQAVNSSAYTTNPLPPNSQFHSIVLDLDGSARLGPIFKLNERPQGIPMHIDFIDVSGQVIDTAIGQFMPYGAERGGVVMFSDIPRAAVRAKVPGHAPIALQ